MGNARFLIDNLVSSDAMLTVSSERAGQVGLAVKVGSGSSTLNPGGPYTGANPRQYIVEVNDVSAGNAVGTAKYRWRPSDVSAWSATGVATSAAPTALESGITVAWVSGGGVDFIAGDYWTITVDKPFGKAKLLDRDRDTEWRSGGVGSAVMLDVDLGSGQAVDVIALCDHNLGSAASIILLGGSASPPALTTGAVTLPNWRVSLESGAAWLDMVGVDLSPYATGQRKITIVDSAGKKLVGWIKAAGDGVTYGSELLSNGGFASSTTPWTGVNGTLDSVAGGQSGNCCQVTRVSLGYQQALQTIAAEVEGRCYEMSAYVKSGSSGNESALIGLYDDTLDWFASAPTSSGSWVQYTIVVTFRAGHALASAFLHKNTATAGTMLFDTASLRQRLTPSSTGATIVSTRGGTNHNWTSEDAGFNRNDSAGYTYTVDPEVYELITRSADNLIAYVTIPTTACRYWRLSLTDTGNPDGYLRVGSLFLGSSTEFSRNYAPQWVRGPAAATYGPSGALRTPRGVWATAETISLSYRVMTAADRTKVLAMFDALYSPTIGTVRPMLFNLDSADSADVSLYELDAPEVPVSSQFVGLYEWSLRLRQRPRIARSGS